MMTSHPTAPLRRFPLREPLVWLCLATIWTLVGCPSDVMSTASSGGTSKNSKDLGEAALKAPEGVLWVREPVVQKSSKMSVEHISQEEVSAWFSQELERRALFERAPNSEAPQAAVRVSYNARVQPNPESEGGSLGVVSLQASVRLDRSQRTRLISPDRRGSWRTEAMITEPLPVEKSPQDALKGLVRDVTKEVAGDVFWQARVETCDGAKLRSFLSLKQPRHVIEKALQEARLRRLREAAPEVLGLLKHPERDVVNLAASALGILGDESMVGALIQAGSRVDPVDRLPVLFALGEIGGSQAQGYLSSIAKSQDLPPGVREAAEDALKRIRENSTDLGQPD